MVEGMAHRRVLIVAEEDVTVTPTHAPPMKGLVAVPVVAEAEVEIGNNEHRKRCSFT
jgi:hypothetical protein